MHADTHSPNPRSNANGVACGDLVGRRVRLRDKTPLLGWTVQTRNRLRGKVVADKNYYVATVRIEAADSWDGTLTESDHNKTDLTLLCPSNGHHEPQALT